MPKTEAEEAMMSSATSIPREPALLQALAQALQRNWAPLFNVEEQIARVAAVGVSAAPGTKWRPLTADTTVELRALVIGNKLFAHFVSDSTAIRVDLLCDEYIATTPATQIDERTQSRVGQWIINSELLQWRLERNVFPHFDTSVTDVATQAGAELGRLPEPLLMRIAPFLSGVDYSKLTQANEFLRGYADKEDVWAELLQHDYPRASDGVSRENAKDKYIRTHAAATRQREQRQRLWLHPADMDVAPPPFFIPLGLRHPGMIPPPFRQRNSDPFHRDD